MARSLCITNLIIKPASVLQMVKKKKRSCSVDFVLKQRELLGWAAALLSFWGEPGEAEIWIFHIFRVSTSRLGCVWPRCRKSLHISHKNNIRTISSSVLPWSPCLCTTCDLNVLETSFAGCSSELCNSMSSFSLGSVTCHPFPFVWIIPHRLVLLESQKDRLWVSIERLHCRLLNTKPPP